MSPEPAFLSVIKPNPPPLWYVTNGEVTVGPVVTDLLKRGVVEGAIPEDCYVRRTGGPWQPLETVREIASLQRRFGASTAAPPAPVLSDGEPRVRSRDQDELCFHVTRLAMLVTGAESAMFHVRERDTRTVRTRCVLGSVSTERLNTELPADDLVFRFACVGRPIFSSLDAFESLGTIAGASEDVLTERFETTDGDVAGAAMVPVFLGRSLRGMLEVARPGHAFRREDLQRAERIAQRALHQREN